MRKIDTLVCHHSASETGTVKTIDIEHRQRGWAGIGYHCVCYADGSLHQGRSDSAVGASVYGANAGKLAICLIGKLNEHPPTDAQLDALGHWLVVKGMAYDIRSDQVKGHGEVAIKNHGTLCPGKFLDMNRIRSWYHNCITEARAGKPVQSLAEYLKESE